MRYVQKKSEPQEFTDWKACANEEWTPTYDDLSGDEKKAVYNSLLTEQGHICCYCERKLIEHDYHIEHLNPQHLHIGDDLDYANFICSCLKKTDKGVPLHCGMLKGDNIISVNPLQPDCQSKFTFTAMGIIDSMDKQAKETIGILGLNINKLIDLREAVAAPFLSDEIDDDEFRRFVEGYLDPKDGTKNAFSSMIEFLFKSI